MDTSSIIIPTLQKDCVFSVRVWAVEQASKLNTHGLSPDRASKGILDAAKEIEKYVLGEKLTT